MMNIHENLVSGFYAIKITWYKYKPHVALAKEKKIATIEMKLNGLKDLW